MGGRSLSCPVHVAVHVKKGSMEIFTNRALDILQDAVTDTLYLIPFLFATYVIMEWLEHRTGAKTQEAIRHAGAAGPIIGAFLGAFPQCGFSTVSATLYAGRVITLGTLFAVFLSTSDEMLPIFIAEQVSLSTILLIIGAKIVVGMIMGFIVDTVIRLARRDTQKLRIHELCKQDNCGCACKCETCAENAEAVYSHYDDCHGDCTHEHHQHNHEHDHDHGWKSILLSALKHTVQVIVFIFVITIALDAAVDIVGEDVLADFLATNSLLSVLTAALVGLIPNCAASIVIADLYLQGVLGAGAMFAGLLVSAGVGLLVLLRTNRPWKQNIAIIALLYVMGVFWGLIVNLLGITF